MTIDCNFKTVTKVAMRASLDCITEWGVSRATLGRDAVMGCPKVVWDVMREGGLKLKHLRGLGGRWFVGVCDEGCIIGAFELKGS